MAVTVKSYPSPEICEREILRYAGGGEDENFKNLMSECLKEAQKVLSYKVCYVKLPLKVSGNLCDFGEISLKSEKLAKNLKGCKSAYIFAATVGSGIDRLISKYGRIAPTKALLFQAIGAERIESLCDTFCEEISENECLGLKPRFSPGYGDLPLEAQTDITSLLNCYKYIGISLNDSLLMSPSKSVTAIVGVTDSQNENNGNSKCSLCDKKDCAFRGAL